MPHKQVVYRYIAVSKRGLACITYLSRLHIIQKRIARLILGKQKYYPSHGLFKELDMLSIYDMNKCSLSMFCYKFNFGLLPDVFDNFFTKVSNVHRHHTRSQCNFHVRASRTIYVDKSVKYRGTLLWNQLRDNVKDRAHLSTFKIFIFEKFSCFIVLVVSLVIVQSSELVSVWFCEKMTFFPIFLVTTSLRYMWAGLPWGCRPLAG